MGNEIEIVKEQNYLTTNEMRNQIGVIHEAMKQIMKDGVHYGTIPGCGDKPALFKPGAEKILMVFKLVNADPIVETLRNDDEEYHVRVKTQIFTREGVRVGDGLGEASTAEEKYAWRAASCDEEYESAPENKRRIKWSIWNGQKQRKFQIRTNLADYRNTVLKMAVKRSLIAATLNVTAASDCFQQDTDEMSDEMLANIRGGATQRQSPERPKPKIVKAMSQTVKPESTPPEQSIKPMPPIYTENKEIKKMKPIQEETKK